MPPTTTKRILIVDDDPAVLDVLRAAFGQFEHGARYQVETATNGFDAFQMVVASKPDLVLIDMQMPGMSGLQLLKQIRALDRRIPIMMVTGNQDSKIAADALRSGIFAYVPKPFDIRQLDHLVALCFQSPPTA